MVQFPEPFEFLFERHRYKGVRGGRGKGASWNFARALLLLGAGGVPGYQRPLRILCARETQKSIADSVHALLSDQIKAMGMTKFYDAQQAVIRGKNGTEFIFAGLKHNINNIKSVEACDICWVEEAQSVSKTSWSTLIPTIRKDDSEIWLTWNDVLTSDDTHQRFVINPPPNSVIKKLTYRDNPWFPQVLQDEMEHLRATDHDSYLHVWEGNCLTKVEGAIYGDQMAAAEKQNRITRVPWDASSPVNTYWDLGFGDAVAVWFVQAIGFEFRVIDYLECRFKPIDYYLKELGKKPYTYGLAYLPWDGGTKSLGTGKSIADIMREHGQRTQVLEQEKGAKLARITATRARFPQCYFDAEKCADGLDALRHYRWRPDSPEGVEHREPVHDFASHAADAFGAFATAGRLTAKPGPEIEPYRAGTAWS